MISTIEIYKAIRERLELQFPDVKVQQKDDKHIDIFPSFYIQYVGKNTNKQAWEYLADNISFNIVYFAKDEDQLEILEIEEAIVRGFKTPLTIPDGENIVEVEINALNSTPNFNDYTLSSVIDFVLMQRDAEAEDETIEIIEEIFLDFETEDMEEIENELI